MNPAIDIRQTTRWTREAAKSITIVALANRDVAGHERAILNTAAVLPFPCEMAIMSITPPVNPAIRWVKDKDWGDRRSEWAVFLGYHTLYTLAKQTTTDFVIIVQADGYAVNKESWTDEFFNYDYIGAPWPIWMTLALKGAKHRRVGSGGFSFRSRKLLETTAGLHYLPDNCEFEDIRTARVQHRTLENAGCRFAPMSVAMKWCTEYRLEDRPFWKPSKSFGFHGIRRNGKPYHTLNPISAFLGAVRLKYTGVRP
jgi:hypothetical protein